MGAVAARVYLSLGADIKAEVTGLNLFWVCWGDRPSLLTCFCCVNKLTLAHSLLQPLRRLILQTHVLTTHSTHQATGRSTEHRNTTSEKLLSRQSTSKNSKIINSKNAIQIFCSPVECHLSYTVAVSNGTQYVHTSPHARVCQGGRLKGFASAKRICGIWISQPPQHTPGRLESELFHPVRVKKA
jgi:hypothetical protein